MESVLAAAVTGILTLIGVLGVLVANIDVLVGAAVLDPAARAIVVALCMAVLSPVMAEIGKHLPEGADAA